MPALPMYLTAVVVIVVGVVAIALTVFARDEDKAAAEKNANRLDKASRADLSTIKVPFKAAHIASGTLGVILVLAGIIAIALIATHNVRENNAIVERIEVAYGVTVNDAGSFGTKDVSRWRIDGNLMRCFFTSSDMNDKNLMLFCKHWDAADSAEFLTPNNLKHR